MEKLKSLYIILFLVAGFQIEAQEEKVQSTLYYPHTFKEDWSIKLGLHNNYLIGDLESHKNSSDGLDLGIGLGVFKQISPSTSLGLSYFGGKMRASNPKGFAKEYRFGVNTNFKMYSLIGKFYFNRLNEHLGRTPNFNIYGSAGLSYLSFDYMLKGREDRFLMVEHGKLHNELDSWAFSVGLGLEKKISEKFYWDFGITAFITNSDFIDGNPTIYLAGNDGDDIILSTSISIGYRFGTSVERGHKWSNSYAPSQNTKLIAKNRNIEFDHRLAQLEDGDLELDKSDSDQDSVLDMFDLEESSPNAFVNFQGIEIKDNESLLVENTVELKEVKAKYESLFFESDKSEIKMEYVSKLLLVSTFLKENDEIQVILVGYADVEGDSSYNMDLSKRRVLSVQRMLVSYFGINSERISLDWKGESTSISSNKEYNRRVDILLK